MTTYENMIATRPENATERFASYSIINNIHEATGNGYLEDVLANENIQALMPRVIKALEEKGFVVSNTYNHSSNFANAEEVREKGNGCCEYYMIDPRETKELAWESDSYFREMGDKKPHSFHFDNYGFDGLVLSLNQVYRSNGSDKDCSVRVAVHREYFENGQEKDFYFEDHRGTKWLANVKIDYRASDRVLSNRINKLLEEISKL